MLCWVSNPSFEFFDHFPGFESSISPRKWLLKPQTCYVCLGWIHRLISPFTVDIKLVYSWDMNGFFLVDMNGIFMANPIQKSHENYPFYIHDMQFTL